VLETYCSLHNQVVNRTLFVVHCYLSWGLVLPLLPSAVHLLMSPINLAANILQFCLPGIDVGRALGLVDGTSCTTGRSLPSLMLLVAVVRPKPLSSVLSVCSWLNAVWNPYPRCRCFERAELEETELHRVSDTSLLEELLTGHSACRLCKLGPLATTWQMPAVLSTAHRTWFCY
jgi:hypothetical protein